MSGRQIVSTMPSSSGFWDVSIIAIEFAWCLDCALPLGIAEEVDGSELMSHDIYLEASITQCRQCECFLRLGTLCRLSSACGTRQQRHVFFAERSQARILFQDPRAQIIIWYRHPSDHDGVLAQVYSATSTCSHPAAVHSTNCFRLRIPILGGSWVVISGVISPLIWVITLVTRNITPLTTTPEPPSRRAASNNYPYNFGGSLL